MLGHEALLNKFYDNDTHSFSRDPKLLYLELQQRKSEIDELKKQNFLFQDQYDLLIPPMGDEVVSRRFCIPLLMLLLVNFCGFKYPQRAWVPQTSDVDDFANIVRVKRMMNEIAHLTNASDAEFQQIASRFVTPLIALGIKHQIIYEMLDNSPSSIILDDD